MNVIITGASKGIGYELAKNMVIQKGFSVLAISRSEDLLEQLKRECESSNGKGNIEIEKYDLQKNWETNNSIRSTVEKHFKSVDILINNAGYLVKKPLANLSNEDINKVFQVNILSVMGVVRDLLPLLSKSKRAHVVNISSMSGYHGSVKFPELSAYGASKAALAGFTELLAAELKETNIHSNCLALGAVQTEMLAEAFPGFKAPLSAKEMAEFISDFALQGGNYYNGKVLPVSASTP